MRPLVLLLALLVPIATPAAAVDPFDRYRAIVDDYQQHTMEARDAAIEDLEALATTDVEKDYLLGILHFIQGVEAMAFIARSTPQRPRLEEVLRDPTVRRYIESAEARYDAVEKARRGYKHIYCKYAELYHYTANARGLEKVTVAVGKAEPGERTQECQGLLEEIAKRYAVRGRLDITRTIFHAAVRHWTPYPKYMLEAMGDLENALENPAQAKAWWTRCVAEADSDTRKSRCQGKLEGL